MDCPKECEVEFVIGLTETSWDGKSVPQFVGGPTPELGVDTVTKTKALLKIGGWMIFTLCMVLIAIRIAIKVADYVDHKPAKPVRKA